jgi:hypothetical protein
MSHPKHVLHNAPDHLFVYAEAFQTIRRTSKLCADAAAFRQALGFPASAATWATVAPVVRGSLSSSTIVTWSDGLQAAERLLAAVQATGQLVLAVAMFYVGAVLAASPDEEKSADTPKKNSKGFGWLQADMRVPLPPWEELEEACHLVGVYKGKHMFLCASPSQDAALSACEVSNDVCRQAIEPGSFASADAAAMSRVFDLRLSSSASTTGARCTCASAARPSSGAKVATFTLGCELRKQRAQRAAARARWPRKVNIT